MASKKRKRRSNKKKRTYRRTKGEAYLAAAIARTGKLPVELRI